MTSPVPTPNWVKYADVVRIVDGDTFVCRLDLGRYPTKIWAEPTVRIAGLWAPEKNEAGGTEATMYLSHLLKPLNEAPQQIVVQTRRPDPRDPYGRCVADVWLHDGRSVAEEMILKGHGTAVKQ